MTSAVDYSDSDESSDFDKNSWNLTVQLNCEPLISRLSEHSSPHTRTHSHTWTYERSPALDLPGARKAASQVTWQEGKTRRKKNIKTTTIWQKGEGEREKSARKTNWKEKNPWIFNADICLEKHQSDLSLLGPVWGTGQKVQGLASGTRWGLSLKWSGMVFFFFGGLMCHSLFPVNQIR